MADGSEARVRQRFTGYERDGETQLDFAEARMYQNKHGRFTAPDPLLASASAANPQTFNRYIYTGNNPVNITDPSGLNWCRNKESGATKFTEGVACESGWISIDDRVQQCLSRTCRTDDGEIAGGAFAFFNGTTGRIEAITNPTPDQAEQIAAATGTEVQATQEEIVVTDSATISDHLVSAGGTIAENTGVHALLDFAGLNPPETEHTTAGRVIGHGLSLGIAVGEIAVGASLIAAGTGGNLFGVGLDLTGVGAAVGVPVHAVSTAAIATGAAIGFHGVFTAGNTSVNIYNKTSNGGRTEPKLPDKTIVQQDGVTVEHNYKSGDHGFAHAHVKGGGAETRIGPRGNPYRTDPPLTRKQNKVVRNNRKVIRKSLNKIGRWLKWKEGR